jgi:hypothetical protein
MSKYTVKLIATLPLFFILLAGCNLPNNGRPTADLGPAITQTFQAVATQIQQTRAANPTASPLPSDVPASLPSNTPTAAANPTAIPQPSLTATPAASATPTRAASLTSTSGAGPIAHINEATYCRTGPGRAFFAITTALAGQDLKVVYATTLNDYVVVDNPNAPGNTCWIWTYYAEIRGSLAGLPVVTPPPTPTPTATPTITPTSTITPTITPRP